MPHKGGLTQFVQWADAFEDATDKARRSAERDRDFYDGRQWTSAELDILRARGQPPTVVNFVQKKINTILGGEIRTRVDPSAEPRTPKHEDDAHIVADAVRYICDREKFDQTRSFAFRQILVEGYGGALVDIEAASSIDTLANAPKYKAQEVTVSPKIKVTPVPWDRIIYDPASRMPDFSDAAHLGVVVWMDYDEAVNKYQKNPHRTKDFDKVLQSTMSESNNGSATFDDRPHRWADPKRKRVKIVEMYYRNGDDWYVAHYTQGGFVVEPRPTGLKDEDGHHECPLIIASAMVTRDNERYGAVRALISSQEEYNKRRSKLLHQLSTKQVIAEEGVVPNVQTAKQQLARPDGWMTVRDGALTDGSLQVQSNADMSQGQFQLLQQSQAEIEGLGPNIQQEAANRGVLSGRAIVAKQQAATLELEPFYDAIRDWGLRVYTAIWHRIKQFKKEEWWIRVRDDKERKGFRFIGINRQMTKAERWLELVQKYETDEFAAFDLIDWPEGAQLVQQLAQSTMQQAQQAGLQLPPEQAQQMALRQVLQSPDMQEPMLINDIAKLDVDIVIDVVPDTVTLQQEEFEKLSTLAASGQVQIPPEILLEASNLRNKRDLIEMIRQAQQPDPAAMEAQQQLQQLQMALIQVQTQLGAMQAQKAQSDAELSQARTMKTMAEAQTHTAEAQAEVAKDQAQATKSAAEAGAIAGGADSPTTRFD